ncbi:hypothetical protein AURDEDRAFT_187731 [Auricularia subglabra TFB-10046 SS5]|nr:hypothetical protein AURDEDRAFT_187731 [Auricularia subglabra TFB-10046 SS5]
MLKVSTPQPVLGPRDAAAPYQIKTRQTTRAARGKRTSVSYYESGSEIDSDDGSVHARRKRKAKKAMKAKVEAKSVRDVSVASRPEPEAQSAVWVDDEVSQWHLYILSRLDEHNARQRQCPHRRDRWPAPRDVSAIAFADDAESRTFEVKVPHAIAPRADVAAHPAHAQYEQQHSPLPVRRRGAPISDLLLSPEPYAGHMVSSWQQAPGSRAGHSAHALPQQERLFETLSRPFNPPLHHASSPAPPAAPAPVWLSPEPESDHHDAPRSVSSASSSSLTLSPPTPTPQQRERVATCWACTTMGEDFCKVHRQ